MPVNRDTLKPFIDDEAMESDSEGEESWDEQSLRADDTERDGERVAGAVEDDELTTIDDEVGEQQSLDTRVSLPSRIGEPTFLQHVITKFSGEESNVQGQGVIGLGSTGDADTDGEIEYDDEEDEEDIETLEWQVLMEEGMDMIARMPIPADAPLWAVRVFDGQEQYSFWVIHEKLMNIKDDPLAAFYRPEFKGWIVVESRSERNVISLCDNISTIPQPPQISLIPLPDRAEWLRPTQHERKFPIMFPAWGRFRSRAFLRSLNLPTRLLRYAGDLVTLTVPSNRQTACLIAIPRLPVKIKGRRSKPLRRLIHPHAFPPHQTRLSDPEKDPLDPEKYWIPTKNHELVASNDSPPGIYHLKDKRFQGLYAPPFAYISEIPTDAFEFNVKPAYSDLVLFYEGYCVATAELGMVQHKNKDFWEWTFDHYSAPPLEFGDRVAAILQNGQSVVGHVRVVRYNEIELEDEVHAVPIVLENIHPHKLRREFRLGDVVKVQWQDSPHHRCKGWVLQVRGTTVDVLDINTKEQFSVHRWQIRFDDMMEEPDDLGGRIDRPDRSKNREMRGYDRLSELQNVKVIIVGPHPYKGWKGRVRMHAGRNLMRVEFESGIRTIDIHINHLLSSEASGLDLRRYHDPNLWMPSSCYAPSLSEEPSLSQQTIQEVPRVSTPTPETVDRSRIRYEDQELPADWLMDDALAQKRIWVHVRNTNPDPFDVDPGFQRGRYDNGRGLVHSVMDGDKAEVRLTHRNTTQYIPVRYLFPEKPTKKKQKVVVLEGDHKGQVFSTGQPTDNGMVPLFRPAAKKSDLVIEATKLARID